MSERTQLLTTRQVAERLGLKPDTILDYIRRGLLPALNVASGERKLPLYRIAEADLESWIEQRRTGAAA